MSFSATQASHPPAAAKTTPAPAAMRAAPATEEVAPGAGKTRTVLIADDHESIRLGLALALGTGGYRVLQAADGAECVRIAQQERPGLILLDLSMPVMDGWAAARALQEDWATARIPRVVLSAYVVGPACREALRTSFAGVLTKPVGIEQLLSTLDPFFRPTTG